MTYLVKACEVLTQNSHVVLALHDDVAILNST